MKRFWWILGFLVLFVSLIYDKAILNYVLNNRIFGYGEVIKNFTIFTNGVFSLIVVGLLILYFKRKLILRFLLGFGATGIIVYLLKIAIRRGRPFETLDIVNLIPETGFSFPSGHAIFAFFCLGFVWKDFKKFRYIWLILVILIAFARLYVGVHYLSDLIGAMLIGLFLGNLFRKQNIFKSLKIFK